VASGAVRGVLTAWLGLAALQALTSRGGSDKAAGLVDVIASVVERALSPDVAAIPNFAGWDGAAARPAGSGGIAADGKLVGAGPHLADAADNAAVIASIPPVGIFSPQFGEAVAQVGEIDWAEVLAHNPALQPHQ